MVLRRKKAKKKRKKERNGKRFTPLARGIRARAEKEYFRHISKILKLIKRMIRSVERHVERKNSNIHAVGLGNGVY